jgi:nucleotide-binding universal stress UspA family protein
MVASSCPTAGGAVSRALRDVVPEETDAHLARLAKDKFDSVSGNATLLVIGEPPPAQGRPFAEASCAADEVVGSGGQGDFACLLLGSMSTQVIHRTDVIGDRAAKDESDAGRYRRRRRRREL